MNISDKLFDNSPFGFAYHQMVMENSLPVDYIFENVNSTFEEQKGLKSSEIIGKRASVILPDSKDAGVNRLELFAEVAFNGLEKTFEEYSVSQDKWFRVQAWSDKDGYFATLTTDITENKRAHLQEKSQETAYKEIFSKVSHSIFVIDITPDGKYIIKDFNDRQLAYLGMIREDVQGKYIEDAFPGEIAKSIISHYDECVERGEEISYEEDVTMEGRGRRHYLTTITPLRDELTDRIYRLVGGAIEITKRKEAEIALMREQKFNKALLESATDGVVACDENGDLVLFNEKAREWHGVNLMKIPVQEGVDYYDLYHIDGETHLKPEEIPLARAFNGELVLNAGMSIVPKGKEPRYIHANGSPIYDRSGNKLGAVILMQDVTAKLKAEEMIRESEEKFRNLAFNVPGVIYLCENDEHYSMSFVNDQVEELTGYSRRDFLDQKVNFVDLMHTDDLDKVRTTVAKSLHERKSYQVEYRLFHKKGEMRWVLENGVGIFDEKGTLQHLEGYISDVTEKKIAEEVAYKAAQQLEIHIENSPLAVIVSDENFEVTQWSKSAENLFGWTEEEVIQKNQSGWHFTHKEDIDTVNQKINDLLEGRKSSNVSRIRNFTKDGRLLYCEWYNSVMFDKSGDIISIFSLVHDVSDRVEKESAIQESLAEKEIMLSEIHHRVKNNLAVVSGLMQLQALGTDDEKLQAELFDSVNRIKTMASVHELLYQSESYSRLDFKETMTQLVKNITETLHSKTKVEIEIECDDIKLSINKAIPTSLIVNEVITNVYKHAFKGRGCGKLTVGVSKKDGMVSLMIKDNGVGIENGNGAEQYHKKSMGTLGMHLIRELVNQLGGSYQYVNVAPGTEFRLSFESSN